MSPAEEILEQMIDEVEDIHFGRHRPGACPFADDNNGVCDTCDVYDELVEVVNQARARLERLRLGIGAVAA